MRPDETVAMTMLRMRMGGDVHTYNFDAWSRRVKKNLSAGSREGIRTNCP